MCSRSFDDLTGTVFAGHHQPLSVWILCLYFMGLNLSNRQIADELEMSETQIHEMTTALRKGIVATEPSIELAGTVECDEVYVVAGHKGHPESVKKKASSPETQAEGTAWSWHGGNGQTTDSGNDSTEGSGGVKGVGECSADHHSTAH
jgi:hypothetical protein